jgi:hypothetical protein
LGQASQFASMPLWALRAVTTEADTFEVWAPIGGRQTFEGLNWWSLAIVTFVIVCGIGFLKYSQSGFIVIGAGLLVVGSVAPAGVVGSRHLEISDVGVTIRRFFGWSHTYPRTEIQGAAADCSLASFSMPLLRLNDGRQVRLWSVKQAHFLAVPDQRVHRRDCRRDQPVARLPDRHRQLIERGALQAP